MRQLQADIRDGRAWVVDLDLETFFDRVNHDRLMSRLKRRGHRFARYADDRQIMLASARAGERVIESVKRFVEGSLRLTVNTRKSEVDRPWNRTFLGFTISRHGLRLKVADKAIAKLKDRVHELTRRTHHVHLLDLLPESRFDRNGLHLLRARSLEDRIGVVTVGLVAQRITLDGPRVHQHDLMTQLPGKPASIVGTAAAFHDQFHRLRKCREISGKFLSVRPQPPADFSGTTDSATWNTDFAKSTEMRLRFMAPSSATEKGETTMPESVARGESITVLQPTPLRSAAELRRWAV